MTRKHYEALADALRASQADAVVVKAIADVLSDENPRFDRDRFYDRARYRGAANS